MIFAIGFAALIGGTIITCSGKPTGLGIIIGGIMCMIGSLMAKKAKGD